MSDTRPGPAWVTQVWRAIMGNQIPDFLFMYLYHCGSHGIASISAGTSLPNCTNSMAGWISHARL